MTAGSLDRQAAPVSSLAEPLVLHARVVTGTGGGPDKTILNSPRYLPRLGYRSICAYMRPPYDGGFDQVRRRAAEASARLVEIDDRGPLDLGVFRHFLELCRREQVAIWHGHDYKSNLIGLWVRRHWPLKLVTTVHGWVKFTWKTPLYYAIDRLCLPRYDQVICVSDDLVQSCRQAGVADQRLVQIDNAIDTEVFRRQLSASEARTIAGLDGGGFLIGAVGRLSPEKGFDVLIRAIGRLAADGCDVRLVIAGEGDDEPRLRKLIGELGLQSRIQLLGFRSDTIALFQALDAFVLPSYREGLPNALLEAMALEVPLVATRIAGIPNVVTDGEDGILVLPGDEDALAGALVRLYADDRLRQQLARAGRRTIESRFSFARRMEKIARVYDQVLGRA